MSSSIDKVRIVLAGDSGCGKSSFVHLIANSEVMTSNSLSWTIGCNVEVKLHEYKEDTAQQKTFFIEFFDIGGSLSHKLARSVFYQQVNGIILVHDLTNRKSLENLKNWLVEIMSKDGKDGQKGNSLLNDDFDPEQFLGVCQLPILVVGTKNDLIDEKQRKANRSQSFAQEIGADDFYINSRDVRSIQAGSTIAVKLQRFFDKVIERKYFSKENSTFYDRSRTMRFATSRTIQSPPIVETNRYFSPFTSPTIGNYSNFSANLATVMSNENTANEMTQ